MKANTINYWFNNDLNQYDFGDIDITDIICYFHYNTIPDFENPTVKRLKNTEDLIDLINII